MITEQPYFVYVFSPKGPVSQKWSELDNGYKREYLAAYPLTEREFTVLTIEELEKIYPMPEMMK